MDTRPIGVFDSGIGGLTILKEVMEQLPGENVLYFGDTARLPYGTRSNETVKKYTFQCLDFLTEKDVKAIVIACNTASSSAVEEAKKRYSVPVFGVIEPGARAAVNATKNGKIGVIATSRTINNEAYQNAIWGLNNTVEVTGKACALFVQLAEEGWADTDVALLAAEKYLIDIKEHEVDTLVLGCTHFPLLRYTIRKVLGEQIKLVDPAFETAKELKKYLKSNDMLNTNEKLGTQRFYVTDDSDKFKRIGELFLQKEITNINKVHVEGGKMQESED